MDYYRTQITSFLLNSSFQLITIYNDIKKHVIETTNYLYQEYPYFRMSFDYLNNLYYVFYSKLVSHKVDPFVENWGGVYTCDLNNRLLSDVIVLNRNYTIKTLERANEYADDMKLSLINDLYINSINDDFSIMFFESFDKYISNETKIQNTFLILMKTKHIYFSRVVTNNSYIYKELTVCKTPKFFMCVEYTHPEMKNKILIPIEKEYYFVGNELLSSVFVLKFLEYQPEPYVFDKNYIIEIMDNNMNTFRLKNNQYVSLEKDGYKVMSV